MPGIEAGEIGPKVHAAMAAVDNGCELALRPFRHSPLDAPSIAELALVFTPDLLLDLTAPLPSLQGPASPRFGSLARKCSLVSPMSAPRAPTASRLTISWLTEA